MALYFADTEITGVKDLFPLSSKDTTNIYFADTELFTVWDTYDGTLPATYSANGSVLADYLIYGASGGVGDETDNLFNPDAMDAESGCYYNNENVKIVNANYSESGYIAVRENVLYTLSQTRIAIGFVLVMNFFDNNKNFVRNLMNYNSPVSSHSFTADADGYVRFCTAPNYAEKYMFTEGSTAPESYIPPGYEIDMSVSDGNTATTTPIYIGDEPLEKDEYVDYQAGKVYRRTAQVMPSAPAETKTQNGITITCDGEGRYSISGKSTNSISIEFSIPKFTTPISVGQGSSGTLSFFNDVISGCMIYFLKSNVVVDSWNLYSADRKNNSYSVLGGKEIDAIRFTIQSGKTISSANTMPMFTDDGVYPSAYAPYYDPQDPPVALPALPTVDGATIVDYAGQSQATPEKVELTYRKEGFK